jgi:hypothetical protein
MEIFIYYLFIYFKTFWISEAHSEAMKAQPGTGRYSMKANIQVMEVHLVLGRLPLEPPLGSFLEMCG